MLITSIHKDYDSTDRLGRPRSDPVRLRASRLNPAEDRSWCHSLVPGAELAVLEHSSHVPHLEDPK
jgi:hypothetical protein